MAYSTLALHLLISAPGDVPLEDLAVIRISQWNLNLGRVVGLTVLPVSWTEHAVAEFGERPQATVRPVGQGIALREQIREFNAVSPSIGGIVEEGE